jgi:hypothetical protein
METIASTLATLGSAAFRWSAIAFVAVNGLAIAAVVVTRDRSFVNRWTSRLLLVNLALFGTGLGLPIIARAARFVVEAVAVSSSATQPKVTK